MRKHPLIALVAFTFLAVSIFFGTSGARTLNSVPVRATARADSPPSQERSAPVLDSKQLTTQSGASTIASLAATSRFWHNHASDVVALHDGARSPKSMLPSAWRTLQHASARARAVRKAARERAARLAQLRARQLKLDAAPSPGGIWLELRECESGDDYSLDTGNGYFGAYQFALSTWQDLGYSGLPSEASAAVQDSAAEALLSRAGWNQWPACSSRLGL